MKKLLVLLFVLALSSMASATVLSWSQSDATLAVNGTITVQLLADDNLNFDGKYVGAEPGTVAAITSITKRAAAGPDAVVLAPGESGPPTDSGYLGWWIVQSLDMLPPSTIQSGAQYDVVITGLGAGSVSFDSGDGNFIAITVPEPATIALLCLGGLLLRKK